MSRINSSQEKRWLESLSDSSNRAEYDEALAQVRANYMQIYRGELFLRLEQDTLCEILDSDELNVENEQVVFDSVRRWLIFNNVNLETNLTTLMRVVRLSLLPVKYLFNEVEPFLSPFKGSRDMFINVLRDHNLVENKVIAATRKYQKKSTMISNCKTGAKSAESGRRLLSIGSDCSNTANVVEIYDSSLDQWIKPNKLNIHRINYSVAFIENKVMLIGGTRSLDESTESLQTVQSLDLSSGILSPEDSLNDARQYSAAVVFGDGKLSFLYVLGGRGNDKDLDSVERWDPLIRKWHRVQPMPSKRTGLAAAFFNGKIYVLGGRIDDNYTNTMEAYDLENVEWEKKASMKEARAHFCVAAFKKFLYAVAGIKENQSHLVAVEKYDPFYDSWITIANIPSIGHVGISFLENRLICAGGKNSTYVFEYTDENDNWSYLKELHEPRAGYLLQLPKAMNDYKFNWPKHENDHQKMSSHRLLMLGNLENKTVILLKECDAKNNQWTRLKDLDIGKTNYSVAIVGENILMIGGLLSNGYQLNAVELLNLRTGNVSQIAPLNYRRQNSAAVVVRQEKLAFVYVIGGMKDEKILNSVERWDSSIRIWTMVTPMSVARACHGAVFLQNKIYVIGGKTTNETYDKTMEAYDIVNDRWIQRKSMNNPNAYFGVTAFKNCIYVAGGNTDATTPINTVECYDPEKDTWTTIANISSTGTVGISGTGNRLICAGGKSSNFVEEYDESEKSWHKLNPLDAKCSGFLIELKPDMGISSNDWIVQRRPSDRLIFIGSKTKDSKFVETFDIVDKKWTKLKNLPISIINFSLCIFSNKLLIIGGQQNSGDQHAVHIIHAIDLSSGTIQPFPRLKHERCSPSSVVVIDGEKTTLYVLGGLFNERSLSSVEKWEPSTNTWTEGVPMTFERYNHRCVFLQGKIYAIGGVLYQNNKELNTMEAFHVKDGIWKTKASMKYTRSGFGITVYKNQIYVAGNSYSYSSVEKYDPPTDTWTTLVTGFESGGYVSLCTLGDRLICAGSSKNSEQEYDFIENKWISLKPMNAKANDIGFFIELPENAKLGNW